MTTLLKKALWTIGMAGGLGVAQAHVSIAGPAVVAGSHARVVLQVPHGCAGSPTVAVTVDMPPGFLVAKPMPKPGWTLSTRQARLPKSIVLHGKTIEQSTSQVRWSGGRLPNEFFDEFVVFGKIDEGASGPVTFRTVQSCEQGESDWSGAAGTASPAPVLQVTPAPTSSGTHRHAH